MNYFEFKDLYIHTIARLMDVQAINAQREVVRYSNALAELEEQHPAWAERVEDWLAKEKPEMA